MEDSVATLRINGQRLWESIEQLSAFTDVAKPWTRRAFTPLYQEGRGFLRQQLRSLGAEVHIDEAGNLIGRFLGEEEGTIAIGSHSDTVPAGGRFDGIIGVASGLELARCLHENGVKLRHSFEVIDFLSEEPSDYGLSCVGSRGMVGKLAPSALDYHNPGGETLRNAILRMGGKPDCLTQPLRRDLICFLECHIEQGVVLEQAGQKIGLVTAIVGLSRIKFSFSGQANHAGTTPMDLRRDALAMFSEFHQACSRKAREMNQTRDCYLVATVGTLKVFPDAANVVPGRVEASLDVRSDSREAQLDFMGWLEEKAREIAKSWRGELSDWAILSDNQPTRCDSRLLAVLEEGCRRHGLAYRTMVSGAGHDCAYLSYLTPSAMIFIPSYQGLSHTPEEWSSPEDVANGCQVLAEALLLLDQRGV